MSEWQSAGVWLIYAVLPAASIVILLVLVKRRFASNALVRAEIVRLEPFFHPDQHPLRAEWLKCDYIFQVRGDSYNGNCLVPLHVFLEQPAQVAIWLDHRLGLPVLFHEGARLIGAEAIEHYLLGHRETIRIRYRVRDPVHNMPLESDILPKKVVENKSSGY